MSCKHLDLRVSAAVNRITREGDPDGEPLAVVAEFNVFCAHCRMPFKFNWDITADPQLLPLDLSLMNKRPWITPFKETLCATVVEHPEGDFYGQHSQSGTA